MLKRDDDLPLRDRLTEREADILACLSEGMSNKEIADKLYLASGTVKWYIRQIYSKLDAHSRTQALARARKFKLLNDEQPALASVKHSLPYPTTPFVGREAELAELYELLTRRDVRLLTILAPGGMGKTRLALEAAEQQVDNFQDGTCFVPLQPLSDVEHVIPTIAEYTGYQFQQDTREPKRQLLDYLANQHLLLVLDNFEHVLDVASLVREILHAAPRLKVLTTSREKLNLSGETVYTLRGMHFLAGNTPEKMFENEAVQLLQRAAQRVQPNWTVRKDNLNAVARVCQMTDGMPLGLLLAASWLDVYSLERIADEIQKNLDFLATQMRDVPERMRSIRAVFEHAWQQLEADERQAFMRLSVFRDGCTLAAAEAVTQASPHDLQAMVNKALLVRTKQARYELHELLRQYAEDELEASGEALVIRHAHVNYFADVLHSREASLKGQRQLEALDEIEADFENIRAAWDWSVKQGDVAAINRMAEAVWLFAEMRSRRQEAAELFGNAVAQLRYEPEAPARATLGRVLARQGMIVRKLGRSAQAEGALRESLVLARGRDDRIEMAFCLWGLSTALGSQGQIVEASQLMQESLTLYREVGDKWGMGQMPTFAGGWAGTVGQTEEYLQQTLESLELQREIGDKFGMARSLNNLAAYLWLQGQDEEALRLNWEALTLRREIGDQGGIAGSLLNTTIPALHTDHFEDAEKLIRESLEIARGIQDPTAMARALLLLSTIIELSGDDIEAHRLAQEALPLADTGGNGEIERWARLQLGWMLCSLGDYDSAADCLYVFLESWLTSKLAYEGLEGVAAAARIAAHRGDEVHAAELLGLAFEHRAKGRHLAYLERRPRMNQLRTELETELGTEAYQAAWERGKTLDLEQVAHQLLQEFKRQ